MSNYTVQDGSCIINDYGRLPAFSGFLPGLTGEDGIPMWVFYTNRGQAIGSLGINSKNNAIMEFFSANAEYENTALKGFRTFIRANGSLYEPFRYDGDAVRTMTVRKNSIGISEEARDHGLKITVNYYVLPHEPVAALVRSVSLENIAGSEIEVELLDGVAKIIPNGISNGQFKEMSNLFKSWTDVRNLENNVPFFAMRASTDDSAEVEEIKGGYFYATVMDGRLSPVTVDPADVFGWDNSLCEPRRFAAKSLDEIAVCKKIYNEVPCAFTPVRASLKAGEEISWTTYLGYAGSVELLNDRCSDFRASCYDRIHFDMAESIAAELTADVRTSTADTVFDAYIEQSYMDNFLRGGYPVTVAAGSAGDNAAGRPHVLYLYSRKHGDPERDYNWFTIDAEYYSQGNGNFRDVCQNRRNDVFFCPELGDYNIRYFFSLMQTDGYNPLEIRPATFTLGSGLEEQAVTVLKGAVEGERRVEATDAILKLLKGKFRPGEIFRRVNEYGLKLKTKPSELVERIIALCSENIEAGSSEGYWSDHWDYLMDLVDNYLYVYPDRLDELVYGCEDYRFYDSEAAVLPRSSTYVYDASSVMQLGSMARDEAKAGAAGFIPGATNWKRNADGSTVEVSLAAKLVTLALNKFSTLDSYGMGIEMEGGKPGWNDAMNGLPAMFACSMPETFELVRLLRFLERVTDAGCGHEDISLPSEIYDYFEQVNELLRRYPLPDEYEGVRETNEGTDDYAYWDAMSCAREAYRERTAQDLCGEVRLLRTQDIHTFCSMALARLEAGIRRARGLCRGQIPTYFTFTPVSFEALKAADGSDLLDGSGRTRVRVTGFKAEALPMFLEGPARYLNSGDAADAREIHEQIKASDIYDRELKMFKTSESLEGLSLKYGRIRAFTPGWLERESVFLHMEYKYLLALQKSGLYDEFFSCMKDAFIPFLDPNRYGRSTLENSSFIASSANPDARVHGRGYVARLSGSTTEVLTMWIRMFLGERGFYLEDNELCLSLAPVLDGSFFNEQGEASWTFMSRCRIIYRNTERRNTYGPDGVRVRKIRLLTTLGESVEVEGDTLRGTLACDMRNGRFVRAEAVMA